MSGRLPFQHGCVSNNLPLPEDCPSLAEMAPENYHKAYFGKWHLGDEIICQRGFDQWLSTEDEIYRRYYSKPEYLERRSDYHHYLWSKGVPPDQELDGVLLYSRRTAALLPERHTKAAYLAREAAAFIEERDRAQPWMLSVSFLEPHMPFYGPLNDWYEPEELPVGPAFAVPPAPDSADHKTWVAEHRRENGFGNLPLKTEKDWRRMRANYYGLVSMVDNALGVILDALQRSGQADNTVVIFTSDHGEMMGDHACIGKCLMYEESIKVPLLMRVPWLSDQQTHLPGRVSQIDFVPTVLELMGTTPPDSLAGQSRVREMRDGKGLEANEVVVEWNTPAAEEVARLGESTPGGVVNWRTLIDAENWKLSLSADGQAELFDLNTDRHELVNRIDDIEQQSRISVMRDKIKVWQQHHGDLLSGV